MNQSSYKAIPGGLIIFIIIILLFNVSITGCTRRGPDIPGPVNPGRTSAGDEDSAGTGETDPDDAMETGKQADTGEETKIETDFEFGVAAYPGAKLQGKSESEEQVSGDRKIVYHTLRLTSEDSVDNVKVFYVEQFDSAQVIEHEEGIITVTMSEKDISRTDNFISVTIEKDAENSVTVITINENTLEEGGKDV